MGIEHRILLSGTQPYNNITNGITGPRITRTLPVDPRRYRLVARLASHTSDAFSRALLWVRNGTDRCLCVAIHQTGTIEVLNANSGTAAKTSTNTALVPVNGTGWVALTYTGELTVHYGTGTSTDEPTAWNFFYSASAAAAPSGNDGVGEATELGFAAEQTTNPTASDQTLAWGVVKVTPL